jgi:lipid-A-disaccharide synthase-like uncharacterized protein
VSTSEITWLTIGFVGQSVFMARFLVQWIASERKGESVIPTSFWYLSLFGSWMLLAYAFYRVDPVIIFGQMFGTTVYTRNLILLHRKKPEAPPAPAADEKDEPVSRAEPPRLRRAG